MEEKYVLLKEINDYGTVNINTKALEVISSHAALEVGGVSKMHSKVTKTITDTFNRNHNRGVEVDIRANGIVIDVYINVKHGESIHKVANSVQQNVSQTVFDMSTLKVSKVYVHVVDIDS